MKKLSLFLASSAELRQDRERFEIEIYRKSKTLHDHDIFLHLEIWEDHTSKMAPSGTQAAYNEKVKACDLFILLAHTKVGIYTAEEFENALTAFQTHRKPYIFTYFKHLKDTLPDPSLDQFQQKLKHLQHFYNNYEDTDDLWNQFNKELDRLLLPDIREMNPPKTGRKLSNNQANFTGDHNFTVQGVEGSSINIHIGSPAEPPKKVRKKGAPPNPI